jgi:Family of unknown function (DUF6529)
LAPAAGSAMIRTMAEASRARLLIPLLLGAGVAVGLGVYGHEHDPTGESIFSLVFTKTINMKAWFATGALALALFQIYSALRLYGRLPGAGEAPPWMGTAHKVSGALAFLLTIPVAYHCLWALGFQDATTRTLVHSLAGCFFYGAFVAKVVVVESRGLPGWALPLAGGTVFTGLVVVWLTSSFWFFSEFGFPSF